MGKAVFITATGTDIGKTYISGLIVKKLKEFGCNVGYYKPVLSGALPQPDGSLLAGDCSFVLNMANLEEKPSSCVSYCFEQAVSPHLAAKINNVTIDEKIIKSEFEKNKSKYDFLVVEGAGGITCPLDLKNENRYLLSDLIKSLNLGVIVVADGGLGTINSVLLTVEYAKNLNIKVEGIILNNYDSNDFMHIDNKIQIEYLTNIKVLATVSKNDSSLNIDIDSLKNVFK